jgi:hypothetical protein
VTPEYLVIHLPQRYSQSWGPVVSFSKLNCWALAKKKEA